MHHLGLLAPGTVTVETLAEINRLAGLTTDTPSGSAFAVFSSNLLDDMLPRVEVAADARLPGIVDLLADWDWLQDDAEGDGFYDSPAVAVFNTWCLVFVERVFADDLGTTLDLVVSGNLTHRLLDDDPALPLLHDYLGGETVEQALTNTLIETLNAMTVEYGSADPDDWLQPIAEIEWAPLGVGSVPNTLWMNRGTYNQITHLGPGPAQYASNVVSPGQSGDAFSPHFSDQLALYATWDYKPMHLNRSELAGHEESVIFLRR
jgi:penicillin amidase